MERRKLTGSRRISSWKDVVQTLQKQQAVGADLLHYSELMKSDRFIYRGPMSPESSFVGYHAVVIEEIKQMDEEWVAVCKLSNGKETADWGYAYVSLEVQYIPVGAGDLGRDSVRGSRNPTYLLSNFIIPEMVEANQKDKEDAESEESEETEEKDSENEEEEEYKEYIPKSKRSRTRDPKPKRSRTEDPTVVSNKVAISLHRLLHDLYADAF